MRLSIRPEKTKLEFVSPGCILDETIMASRCLYFLPWVFGALIVMIGHGSPETVKHNNFLL
jgi:hypothetical protein|tara:strand:- start:378 stop:560 length:183 start_codon:yes stop_codon:yes gene_type:complete